MPPMQAWIQDSILGHQIQLQRTRKLVGNVLDHPWEENVNEIMTKNVTKNTMRNIVKHRTKSMMKNMTKNMMKNMTILI